MPRKIDLERLLQKSYDLIAEYEIILTLSDSPKERARAALVIDEQKSFLKTYLKQYLQLCSQLNTHVPEEIAEIIAAYHDVDDQTSQNSIHSEQSGGLGNTGTSQFLDRADDIFTYYRRGLAEILKQLDNSHPRYLEALTLQARLWENENATRIFGDTETRLAERVQIINSCNSLALEEFGISFNEMCQPV